MAGRSAHSSKQREPAKVLLHAAEKLQQMAATEGSECPTDLIQRLKEQLDDFDIVVIGQYNAGKSTFLNALLGFEKGKGLPVGSLPTTRYLWRIRPGDEFLLAAKTWNEEVLWSRPALLDPDSRKIDLTAEERENSGDYLEVTVSSQWLRGLQCNVWDTPGMDDPSGLLDYDALDSLLERSEAAILLTTYDEHGLLDDKIERLTKHDISEILVVITNASRKDPEQFETSRRRYEREVRKAHVLPKEAQVLSIDSARARETYAQLARACEETAQKSLWVKALQDHSWRKIFKGPIREFFEAVEWSGLVRARSKVECLVAQARDIQLRRAARRLTPIIDALETRHLDEIALCEKRVEELRRRMEELSSKQKSLVVQRKRKIHSLLRKCVREALMEPKERVIQDILRAYEQSVVLGKRSYLNPMRYLSGSVDWDEAARELRNHIGHLPR